MIKGAVRAFQKAVFGEEKDVEKAVGTHIFRPVLNATKWAEWLTAAGVPNPKTAEELRVSILQITGQFQLVPNSDAHVFRTDSMVFGVVDGKLAAIWYDYGYYDRHWTLREIVGYDCWCYHTRSMLVLSDDPGDFTFSTESLESVPRNIALDGERSEPLDSVTTSIVKSAPKPSVTPDAAMQEKAKAALLEMDLSEDPNPLVQARLYEISKGKPFDPVSAMGDLGSELMVSLEIAEWVEGEIQKTADKSGPRMTMQVLKKAPSRQTVYGFSSVATVDGELYEDLHGDTISVEALHDTCTLIVEGGQNLGAVEHAEETPNSLVAAVVIDDEFAASLSDIFYFEGEVLKTKKQGLFTGYRFADADAWEANKDLPIEFSINGTAYIEPKEAV